MTDTTTAPVPMSDDRLALIRLRAAAAAPRFIRTFWPPAYYGCARPPADPHLSSVERLTSDDVAFLAEAKPDVLALLAEVERLKAERDALHGSLEQFAARWETAPSRVPPTPDFGEQAGMAECGDQLRAILTAARARADQAEVRIAELASAHNALLADGARWQSRTEQAEAQLAQLRELPRYAVSELDDMLLPDPTPDGAWVPWSCIDALLRMTEPPPPPSADALRAFVDRCAELRNGSPNTFYQHVDAFCQTVRPRRNPSLVDRHMTP